MLGVSLIHGYYITAEKKKKKKTFFITSTHV